MLSELAEIRVFRFVEVITGVVLYVLIEVKEGVRRAETLIHSTLREN